MGTFHAPSTSTHASHDLRSLMQAAPHAGAGSTTPTDADPPEIEIDIDREIWCLELMSGVAKAVGHGAPQTRSYIAGVARICADAVDSGATGTQIHRMVAAASRLGSQPWRALAHLLVERCLEFVHWYGVEAVDGPSGEIVRWLFTEGPTHQPALLH